VGSEFIISQRPVDDGKRRPPANKKHRPARVRRSVPGRNAKTRPSPNGASVQALVRLIITKFCT